MSLHAHIKITSSGIAQCSNNYYSDRMRRGKVISRVIVVVVVVVVIVVVVDTKIAKSGDVRT